MQLPNTESQFVVGMLLVSVFCIFLSLVSLAVAVVAFSWAELSRRVAIFVTATLVFPFSVVGTVVLIYKCTLFRWSRERNREDGIENQGDVPLEGTQGENQV